MQRNQKIARKALYYWLFGSFLALLTAPVETQTGTSENAPQLEDFKILPEDNTSLTQGIFSIAHGLFAPPERPGDPENIHYICNSIAGLFHEIDLYAQKKHLDTPTLEEYYKTTLAKPNNQSDRLFLGIKSGSSRFSNHQEIQRIQALGSLAIEKKALAETSSLNYVFLELENKTKLKRQRVLELLGLQKPTYKESKELLHLLQSLTQDILAFFEHLTLAKYAEEINDYLDSLDPKNKSKSQKKPANERKKNTDSTYKTVINFTGDLIDCFMKFFEEAGTNKQVVFFNPFAPLLIANAFIFSEQNEDPEFKNSLLRSLVNKGKSLNRSLENQIIKLILNRIPKEQRSLVENLMSSKTAELSSIKKLKTAYLHSYGNLYTALSSEPIIALSFFIGGQELAEKNSKNLILAMSTIRETLQTVFKDFDKLLEVAKNKLKTQTNLFDSIEPRTGVGRILQADAVLYRKSTEEDSKLQRTSLSTLSNPGNSSDLQTAQKLLEEIAFLENLVISEFGKPSFSRQRFSNAFQQVLQPEASSFIRMLPRIGTQTKFIQTSAKTVNTAVKPIFKVLNDLKSSTALLIENNLANKDSILGSVEHGIWDTAKSVGNIPSYISQKTHPYFAQQTQKIKEKYGPDHVTYGYVNETLSYAEHLGEKITEPLEKKFQEIDTDPETAKKMETFNNATYWGLRLIPLALAVPIANTLFQEGRQVWLESPDKKAFILNASNKFAHSLITLNAIPTFLKRTFAPFMLSNNRYKQTLLQKTTSGELFSITEHLYQPRSFVDQIMRVRLWLLNGFLTTRNISKTTPKTRTYTYTLPKPLAWGGLLGMPTRIIPLMGGIAIGGTIATATGLAYSACAAGSTIKVAHACAEGDEIWSGSQKKIVDQMRQDLRGIHKIVKRARKLSIPLFEEDQFLSGHMQEIKKLTMNEPFFNLKEKAKQEDIFTVIATHTKVKQLLPRLMYHLGIVDLHLATAEFLGQNTKQFSPKNQVEELWANAFGLEKTT